ncbi:DUF1800 domain-containing protein [Dactylosporangium roseum]|uniref:DUF1800 domain-containing protein n=1 Tax=Dactylosporangium roseum TaxID=47989 RepID=A0ABY5Z918_9ACTN|nr:DUF1800 domain-containing protein [Dactylosporangium roseum]UWZ38590.1 DUF1800 domain-containing protein [Dactylosporangium roseum]
MPERLFSDDPSSADAPKKSKGALFADYTGEFPLPRVLRDKQTAQDDETAAIQPRRGPGGPAPAWLRAGRPALHELTRNRRQALMALGGGAVAIGGLGSGAAAVLGRPETDGDDFVKTGNGGGNVSPQEAGSFSNRDSSYTSGQGDLNDLGASGLADTPSAAAVAAMRATPRFPSPLNRDPVLHLLRRCTFGPTQADIAAVKQLGIDAWLDQQLDPANLPDPVADAALKATPTATMAGAADIRAAVKEYDNKAMNELSRAVIARQIWSTRQLFEVMVDFWNNHLNITSPFDGGWDTRVPYDVNVIRKHALGKFSDMLIASARDPAMMRYLDNTSSDRRNVNENYGRELLELHTVGIDGGYTEKDVRNSAYLMTGRTAARDGTFKYDQGRHWTGAVKVLGFQHANKSAKDGLAVGDAYLMYLATHPSTARYIARKLAVRFVCDTPPQALVDRLAKTYQESGSAVVPVLKVLFRSLEFWIAAGLKTRRPLENFVATARVVGTKPGSDMARALDDLYSFTRKLGQPPLGWEPPDGYPDVATAWSSAAGMLETWNAHRAFVQGQWKGLSNPKADTLVAQPAATLATYLDVLCNRLIFQPMKPAERDALIKFLGARPETRVTDPNLGGKLPNLAPLVLDSIYHALR